jgi:OPA family glycerol-3-phosphate transporter-like MFS transporter
VSPGPTPRRVTRGQVLTVALLVAGYSGYYLCRSNLSVCMPLLIDELARRGIRPDQAQILLGSLASAGVLAYAIGKFPSGNLADLFGGRRNFLTGMAGAIVFTLIFAASGTLPLFSIAWMGNRLVQSLGWAGAVKITSRWFPFRQYGTVMAIVSLSYLFGDAVARQFMALLIDRGLSWREVFVVAALVLAALLVACSLWLRETPPADGGPAPAVNPANLFEAADGRGGRRVLTLLRPFLRSRVFWIACIVSLGTTILRETFTLWTPTYFAQATGMSTAAAASNSAWFSFIGGVSVIVCGALSDRLGRGGRAALMWWGLMLATVALLIMATGSITGTRNGAVILVAVVAFLTIGPYSFLAGAVALDFGGKEGSGTASGLIDGVGYLGGVVSGDTMARVSVAFGWSGAFLVLAGVAAFAGLAAGAFYYYERQSGGRALANAIL